jgi:predicted DsbA family dithiol-disulfide isomerase
MHIKIGDSRARRTESPAKNTTRLCVRPKAHECADLRKRVFLPGAVHPMVKSPYLANKFGGAVASPNVTKRRASDLSMTKTVKIDFISDVSCPWCVIGLGNLDVALKRFEGQLTADIRFHPFELNPGIPPEGESRFDNVARKYNVGREQAIANRERQRALAAQVGFDMVTTDESRFYNTFDAHRLLHWARIEGRQAELKRALLAAYHTNMQNPGDHSVLVAAAESVGLEGAAARDVLTSGRYADEVRDAEENWHRAGISGVPAVVVNDRHLITGAQPPDAFEKAIRKALSEVV